MAFYPDPEEIQGWVEWTRANLPREGDIPYLDWSGPEVRKPEGDGALSQVGGAEEEEPPWMRRITDLLNDAALGGAEDHREAMLNAFVQMTLADLADLAPRFTALHLYYNLAVEDWLDYSLYSKELLEDVQSAFLRHLRTLVCILPIEECPHDWGRIKWEVSSALAVGEWDRVGQLFKIAEAFSPTKDQDLWAIRGQVGFFVAFDKDTARRLKTHSWLLSANPPDLGGGSPLVLEPYGVGLCRAPEQILAGNLDQETRDTARDARNDLEKALQSRTDLSPVYHAMLGTCHLALEEYSHAADEYGIVLNTETTFLRLKLLDYIRAALREADNLDTDGLLKHLGERDYSRFWVDFKPKLLQVLAKCHALAGEPDKARAVYQQWAREYRHDPEAHLGLAELLEQETKFEEAYHALRKAVDLKPELDRELPYKIALALGAIAAERHDLDRLAREAIKEHPEVEKLLDLLFSDTWPTYGKLSPEARGPWLLASLQTYYIPCIQPTSAPQFRQVGAEKFAKAVEIELRQRVFDAFKKDSSEVRSVVDAVERARKDQRALPFAKFLLEKGWLTLGQMEFVLREALAAKGELFRLFGEWTRQHFPKFDSAQLNILNEICTPRNLESHQTVPLDVSEVPGLCRAFLDALLAGTAEKALPSE
jgi:tetratricopeptide (TPR) repeat protein